MSGAMTRAADAMMRALGSGTVVARLPVTSGETPSAEEVELSPALILALEGASAASTKRYEVLVSARAAAKAAESRSMESAETLFASASGLRVGERWTRVEEIAVEMCGGVVSLYRLTVSE